MRRLLAIAPMMAYTDRHYRYFMRLLTRHTVLYTEMVHSQALQFGVHLRWLAYSPTEHPLALQVGGSDPTALAYCARLAANSGFDEINLNVGCPSKRVQQGQFGACLFKQPVQVAQMIAAMRAAASIPITVKTRIGVDDWDSYKHLCDFITQVSRAGCQVFIIHARKAWLKGLNPKQNRDIPPLCYPVVYQLKQDFPHLEIIVNGGVDTLLSAQQHLQYVDGVMIGRAAYVNPYLFAEADNRLFSTGAAVPSRSQVTSSYLNYMVDELEKGAPLRTLLKPLIGLYQGQPRAREWRRMISEKPVLNPEQLFDDLMQFSQVACFA